MVTPVTLTVAGTEFAVPQALARFAKYPRKTPDRFDYPPRGDFGTISLEEIKRTRYVSSRISYAQGDCFVTTAADAPWIPADSDLANADPEVRGGLFDGMSDLYRYFSGNSPKGIAFAKIHKVLHVKYPGAFPLLDSRLWKSYRDAARTHKSRFPELWDSEHRWLAVRDDLVASRTSDAIGELREAMTKYEHSDPDAQKRVRDMTQLTDVRLLDILVW